MEHISDKPPIDEAMINYENAMIKMELEILQFNRLEHFKANKELIMVLGVEHPKVQKIQSEMNQIAQRMTELKNLLSESK